MEVDIKIQLLLSNDTTARKSFSIPINELIILHPDIFTHLTAKQGIRLIDESKRPEAIEILKKYYIEPKMKISTISTNPDVSEIIYSPTITLEEKIKEIQRMYPNFSYSQIKQYLYRIKANEHSTKTKKNYNDKFTEEIINIINQPKLTTSDKIKQIQKIDSTITREQVHNYIQRNNINAKYNPYKILKEEMNKRQIPYTYNQIIELAQELEIPEIYLTESKIRSFITRNK